MILKFFRFESEIELSQLWVSVLEVQNRTLFTRIVESLVSGKGDDAGEPYGLWDEKGKVVSASKSITVVSSLPEVPVYSKSMLGKLYKRIAAEYVQNSELEAAVETLMKSLSNMSGRISSELWGAYAFGVNLELPVLIKALALQPACDGGVSLFDKLIQFFKLCVDIGQSTPIVFVNLKSFLSQEELKTLYEQAFFYGQSLLLLESWHDVTRFPEERKTRIDQCLLEF